MPVTALAVFGFVALWRQMRLVNSPSLAVTNGDAPTLSATDQLLEIDLRSTAPVLLLLSGARPQFYVYLRVTNLSDEDIRITHLTADVWFGQPMLKFAADLPVKVPARSTERNVAVSQMVEASAVEAMKEYLARDDFSKNVAVTIMAACESTTASFTKTERFELRDKELLTIIR
jgi:hypothetical protein